MRTFKAIGALLDYPTAELVGALDEVEACVEAEGFLGRRPLAGVRAVVAHLRTRLPLDLQEDYVALFDRTRRLSLHLHEHSYGESRDRGQAMVELATAYRLHGFELAGPEMPDYLPLFLEFLSELPEEPARRYLADAVDILEALRVRLDERGSVHARLLEALVSLSAHRAERAEVEAILGGEPKDPATAEELDEAWAEEPVTFSPGAALGDCPYARGAVRDRLQAAKGQGA